MCLTNSGEALLKDALRNNGTCHKLNNITGVQKSFFLIDTQRQLYSALCVYQLVNILMLESKYCACYQYLEERDYSKELQKFMIK